MGSRKSLHESKKVLKEGQVGVKVTGAKDIEKEGAGKSGKHEMYVGLYRKIRLKD